MITTDRRKLVFGGASCILAALTGRAFASMSKEDLPAVALAFLPSELSMKRRIDWTKQVPKPWILKPATAFDRITVHHSAAESTGTSDNSVIAEIETICIEHKARGYGDIGYHFVIDPRGVVWEARSLAYEGAHVSGQNDGNIGIVLLGNFEVQTVNEKQTKSLAILIAALRDRFQVKRHRLFGHRDLGKSVCPGQNLYVEVEKLKKAEEAIAGKGQ